MLVSEGFGGSTHRKNTCGCQKPGTTISLKEFNDLRFNMNDDLFLSLPFVVGALSVERKAGNCRIYSECASKMEHL